LGLAIDWSAIDLHRFEFRASAKNFVRFVVPEFRHSGERRNPGISILDPGFRRGDDQGGQSVTDKIMDNCYIHMVLPVFAREAGMLSAAGLHSKQ
jgi:hypothetical protein